MLLFFFNFEDVNCDFCIIVFEIYVINFCCLVFKDLVIEVRRLEL